jgi:tyrosine-protein phosphatase YwqE
MNNSILYSAKIGGYSVEVRNIKNLINSITKLSKHNDYEIHLFYSNELKIEVYNYIKNLNQKHVQKFNEEKFSWFDWLRFN